MLTFFRSLAKSRIVSVLIGIPLLAGLLVFGNARTNLSSIMTPNSVIAVGGRTFSAAEYKREFEAYRRDLQQQQQQQQPGAPPVSDTDLVNQGIDRRLLDVYAQRESLAALLQRGGVDPSEKQIGEQIRQVTDFFNPISGKFDEQIYEQRLRDSQVTPQIYEHGLHDQVAYVQFASAVAAGLQPPKALIAGLADYEFEQHALSFFALDPHTLGAPPQPTDEQLKGLMAANIQALTTPETRLLTIARFSAAAIAPTVAADPAEVKKRYDFRKDTLSTPEKRTVVQIPAKSAQDAAGLAAALAKGQDPDAIAKAAGVQPLHYIDKPKAGIADPQVAEAAFNLPEGRSSGPIQGQLGYAVIKVIKVTPGRMVTFEEARPQIEQEVKAETAQSRANDLAQKFEESHDKGANLAEAAKAAGVPTLSMGPVTATGNDVDGKPMAGLSPRALKEAFALAQGGETDVIQDSKGEYFAIRADKVIAPQPPTLDDKVRAKLTQFFIQTQMGMRMNDRLNQLAADVRKGKTLDAVAASTPGKLGHLVITRAQAQQNRALTPQQLEQIFVAKRGDVLITGGAVVKVDAVDPPSPSIMAAGMAASRAELAQEIVSETNEEGRGWAKTFMKAKINGDLARQALGVAPTTSSTPPAGGAGVPGKRAQ